jgi:hypothetical protein
MPVPPDYEPSKKPTKIKLSSPSDWMLLLVGGVVCVFISGGDLEAIGNQLTGAALTAFKVVVDKRHQDSND